MMKKVYLVLGVALSVITVCMILLVFKGVSLRSEPIIKPSPIDVQYKNITYGIVHRMFPQFQKTAYVIWGIKSVLNSEEATIFELLQKEYTAQFGNKPQILRWTSETSNAEIEKCVKPCWIIMEKSKANSLRPNLSLDSIKTILGPHYFSLTFLEFQREMQTPAICETEQRLDFECLLPVAVREMHKYFKKSEIRYFFTRAYNDIDFFLFIEKKNF